MTKPTILIVDDMPGNLDVLSAQLKQHGLKVLVATTGERALQRVQDKHPDLILLDVVMPDMDGFEVCRQLKASPSAQDIPVLFITMLTDTADKIKGFEAGGVDYITKPFQPQEVLARINAHLTIRRLHRQVQQEYDRFRSLTEAVIEGIIIHDGERIIDINQAAAALFGAARDALLGREVLTLFAPASHPIVLAQIRVEGTSRIEEIDVFQKNRPPFLLEMQTRTLPWQDQTLRITVLHDITRPRRLESEILSLRATLHERDHLGELVGKSPVMCKVYDRLISAAAADETVIIYGETGTGKELAARTMFGLSERHTARFVPVNCGGIPKDLVDAHFFGYCKGAFTGALRDTPGCFDDARGGTLFLDEVGELPPAIQTALLRVLNDGTYTPVGGRTERQADARIIAATNRNLRDLVLAGQFREDFFHRLHVIALEMPPLRQRREDIPLLIRHFLAQRASAGEPPAMLPAELVEQFMAYEWPGNVRELYNELRRYLATGEVELGGVRALEPPADLREMPFLQADQPLAEAVDAFERFFISRALNATQGQKIKTAAKLGVTRKTLYDKIKKLDI